MASHKSESVKWVLRNVHNVQLVVAALSDMKQENCGGTKTHCEHH